MASQCEWVDNKIGKKIDWVVDHRGQWLMDHTYLQAGDSRVLLGSTLGHILFNISNSESNSLEEMMENISI